MTITAHVKLNPFPASKVLLSVSGLKHCYNSTKKINIWDSKKISFYDFHATHTDFRQCQICFFAKSKSNDFCHEFCSLTELSNYNPRLRVFTTLTLLVSLFHCSQFQHFFDRVFCTSWLLVFCLVCLAIQFLLVGE